MPVTLLLALLLAATPAVPAAPDPLLTRTVDQEGVRLGMTRATILAAASRDRVQPCTTESDGPTARMLIVECGTGKMTALFTDAGTVWSLRTSLDLTGEAAEAADVRRALVARYGAPTATANAGSTLIWLPAAAAPANAERCWGEVTLLSAAVESEAAQLPPVDPACLPLRVALLSAYQGHHGVIVETQDPRPRLAELTPAAPAR